MSGLVSLYRLVTAFVQPSIVVWDMTGGTAHAAIVTALITALDPHMTALAIGAYIGIDGLVGLFLESFNVGFGDLYQLGREIVGKGLHERFGVFSFVPNTGSGPSGSSTS